MAPSAIDPSVQVSEPENAIPPAHLYAPREAHFEEFVEPRPEGYRQARSRGPDRAAIVIDNGKSFIAPGATWMLTYIGSSATRAGWSFEDSPSLNIVPIYTRYRDRKIGKTYSFVGTDVYTDTTARGHMRKAC